MKKVMKLSALLLVILLGSQVFAQATPVENLYNYTMDNGLEVFVVENHIVPLVYIEICVKGGGVGQSAENAGLFHLYEHMMFKGNSKYKTAEEMQNAITSLGVPSWNGSTGSQYVNYFFTVPADKLEEGLEFWSWAIREPKMDPREFEAEKKVVLSEIDGTASDPSQIYYDFTSDKLFPEAPWTRSPGGEHDVVENATIDQLIQIKNEYYVPNNSALFIGGDVDPDEAYALAEKIWGSWERADNPWIKNNIQLTQEPLAATEYWVLPFDQISPYIAQIEVQMRGPDAEYDEASTIFADLLFTYDGSPDSDFMQTLVNDPSLGIPDPNYCAISYYTQRRNGIITADAVVLSPETQLAERTQYFADILQDLLAATAPDGSEASEEMLDAVKQTFYNNEIFTEETAEGLISTLSFWWSCISKEYFYSYIDNLRAASADDLNSFIDTYLNNRNMLVTVYLNPSVLEASEEEFRAAGFKIIGVDD